METSDERRVLASFFAQLQMALMEGAHGGNETHHPFAGPRFIEGGAQCVATLHNLYR